MEELFRHINRLVEKLKQNERSADDIEAKTIRCLGRLSDAIGRGQTGSADQHMDQLRRFWLNAVPWCSELSREIEKILIQYEENKEEGFYPKK